VDEVRNITFPTWEEVKMASVVVVFLVAVFMLFVGVADFVVSGLLKLILGIF
jgi:preprotein translocase SecE subunit